MLAPFLLLLFSTASAVIVAYGTNARWGTLRHGVTFIIESRRLQWPLVALAVVLCLVLLILVVAGRRRVWWLIGLLPVLTLLSHRFLTRPDLRRQPVEDPPLLDAAAAANVLQPGDWVVGVQFAGHAIAFPFSQMYRAPAVLVRDREQRMILMWSPGANKATAYTIGRELHARDLEVVSFPAAALLLYDARLGTFINGITAQTTTHTKPTSFRDPLAVEKQTWAEWLAQHPQSEVMDLPGIPAGSADQYDPTAHPIAGSTATVILTPCPALLSPGDVPDAPVNLTVKDASILLLRETGGGRLRAFDRRVESDLIPRFSADSDAQHPTVAMLDTDTNTEWSANASAVAGPPETQGRSLAEIPVETQVSPAAMEFWFPTLQHIGRIELLAGVQPPAAATVEALPAAKIKAHHHRRRKTVGP